MDWVAIFAPLLVGIVLIFVPGLLVACSMRMRGIDAVGISPALSVAIIAISAIIAPMAGLTWAIWVPFAFAIILAAIGYALTSAQKFGFWDFPKPKDGAPVLLESRWFSKNQGIYWVSFLVGAILLYRNITNTIGKPQWISQTYDVNFHLNAIRYIADQGNGSSTFLASMTSTKVPVDFYPAAWHDIASLMFMTTGAEIPVVANALAVLMGAIIWPLSLVYLMRNSLRLNVPAILSIGAVSAAFVAFPLLLLFFGVLYPNILGISLMPVGMAIIVQMFRLGAVRRLSTVQSVYLGVFVALGIALAHPNSIMSLLVLLVPVFVGRIILQVVAAAKKQIPVWLAGAQVVGIALILWLIYFLWGVVRPEKEAGGWEPTASESQSFGEFILNGVVGWPALWFVSLLGVVGLYALVRQRNRNLWLLGSWLVLCYFYMAVRYLTWDEGRDWVVGVWYHDAYRLAALLPLVMAPVALLGVNYLAQKLLDSALYARLSHKFVNKYDGAKWAKPAAPLGAVSAIVVLLVGIFGQSATPLKTFITNTFWDYAPQADSPLLTDDEYKVLDQVDDYVPAGDTVLVQPWTGGALVYAVADRKVNAYHTNSYDSEDFALLGKELNQAGTNPEVCQAIERNHAYYYLDFGTQEIMGSDHSVRFSGYKNAPEETGMELLYQSGDAALYKITACE